MRVVSVRRKGRLLFRAFTADSPWERTKGLMFARAVKPLVFEFNRLGTTENSIHSFFCPIFDAVFLDESKRIVDIRLRVKPWRFIVSKKACKFLLELPPGRAGTLKTGDRIDF